MYDLQSHRRGAPPCWDVCGRLISAHAVVEGGAACMFFNVIKRSLKQAAAKVWPTTNHRGEPWGGASWDLKRQGAAGTPLTIRSCLLYIKGDWAKYAHTYGFAQWNTVNSPCPFCFVTKPHMYDVNNVSFAKMGAVSEGGTRCVGGSLRRARAAPQRR